MPPLDVVEFRLHIILRRATPNLVWVSDFTYVKVGGRFYYICAILDLYARKVAACRVGNKIDRFLAIDTLRDAVRLQKNLVSYGSGLSVYFQGLLGGY